MKKLDFKIDYENPQKYLIQGEQTQFVFSADELLKVKQDIGEIKTAKDLHKIILFMENNKIKNTKQEQEVTFKRTAKEIFESKVYIGGCTDYALVYATIARQLGIPTVYMATADLTWIKEYENGNGSRVNGHDTCESFIDGKWIHIDTSINWIDESYNKDSLVVKYKDEILRQVFWKGIDLFEINIRSVRDMTSLVKRLVIEDK